MRPDSDTALLRRKTCTGCNTSKAWSEFWPRTKWPDDTVRTVYSRCRDCMRAKTAAENRARLARQTPEQAAAKRQRQMEYRMRHLDRIRAEDTAKQRRRRAADPDGFRARQAAAAARYRARMKQEAARAAAEQSELVPLAPFAAWLHEHMEIAANANVTVEALAARAGISARYLHLIASCHVKHTRMDLIDSVLCGLGHPHILNELYPHAESEAA